jgi:hypothetical protein
MTAEIPKKYCTRINAPCVGFANCIEGFETTNTPEGVPDTCYYVAIQEAELEKLQNEIMLYSKAMEKPNA